MALLFQGSETNTFLGLGALKIWLHFSLTQNHLVRISLTNAGIALGTGSSIGNKIWLLPSIVFGKRQKPNLKRIVIGVSN